MLVFLQAKHLSWAEKQSVQNTDCIQKETPESVEKV